MPSSRGLRPWLFTAAPPGLKKRNFKTCASGSLLFCLRKIGDPLGVPQAGESVRHIRMSADRFLVKLKPQARCVVEEELAVADWVPAADQAVAPGDVELS